MNTLEKRILAEGFALPGNVLKVDSFINHQIDPESIQYMGRAFARRFADERVDKVVTVEASGIAIALCTAAELGVKMVFARKGRSVLMDEESYSCQVASFTHKETRTVSVLKKFLPPGERILIIDDVVADGNAALGLCSIVEQAGSTVVGIGVAIEKSCQPGAERIRSMGYRLESLAKIKSLQDGIIEFVEDGAQA